MSLNIKTICTEQWRLHELDLLIDEIHSKISDAVSELKIHPEKNYTNIVLHTAGKTISTMREILCLSASGYPDGALSIARNLYEQLIILYFFENHQEDEDFNHYVSDYHLDYELKRIKAWIYEKVRFKKYSNGICDRIICNYLLYT